jgi:CBS domain-containing protein
MARTTLDEAPGLMVADVIHSNFSALPAQATIGDVQAWFAGSTSRRMALLSDDGRYMGSLVREDLDGVTDPARAAIDIARRGPTVEPGAPATRGRELALQTAARRVPVVDGDERLLGIVAVTADLQGFCGTGGDG